MKPRVVKLLGRWWVFQGDSGLSTDNWAEAVAWALISARDN